MALIVGTDTYISVTDATTYISQNYTSGSTQVTGWTALSSGDKEVRLRQAMAVLESLPVQGMKVTSNQTLQFPRILHTMIPLSYNFATQVDPYYFVQGEVPNAVKYAQVELALELMDGKNSDRVEMQRQGVKSFSLGQLSESYGGQSMMQMISAKAYDFMKPFIGTAVEII